MTIAEAREKCKKATAWVPRDVLLLTILVLSSSASFGLGYLAGREAGEGRVTSPEDSSFASSPTTGQFVAAKGGTKYYLPSCSGADRIAEANRVWFASAAAALAAGYAPAAHCEGL